MNISLKLKRAHTEGNNFDFDVDIPPHCAAAAYTLFVLDTLELTNTRTLGAAAKKRARKHIRKAVMTSLPCSGEKLQGAVHCTMRVAAFVALLKLLPSQSSATAQAALAWAQSNRLRGHTREGVWNLNDVMFSLEALVVHWETFTQSVWDDFDPHDPDKTCRIMKHHASPLSAYLLYLWKQCARFVFMKSAKDIAEHMNAGQFTLPYSKEGGSGHEVALHTKTITVMCEIWRFTHYERSITFSPSDLQSCVFDEERDEATFLSVFAFEKNQLDVDKFRELLRKRLAGRFLCPADAEIYRQLKGGGKKFDPDSVLGDRHTLNLPGFLQEVSGGWSFEDMCAHPRIRDELYLAMCDSGCRSKCGSDFTTRFYKQPGPPVDSVAPSAFVPVVKRYGHATVVVQGGLAVTPPVPFASAFAIWCRRCARQNLRPYGINFEKITSKFLL